VVLPRRVSRQLRLTRLFYRASWPPFRAGAALFKSVNRREAFLSLYGPLSLVMLLALWAGGLITAFAFLHYGAGSAVDAVEGALGAPPRLLHERQHVLHARPRRRDAGGLARTRGDHRRGGGWASGSWPS
jgi:hypothetical protein